MKRVTIPIVAICLILGTATISSATLSLPSEPISSEPFYLEVTMFNNPPQKPTKPVGQLNGDVGTTYDYTTSSTDPDGHKLKYGWDWDGDDVVDEWDDNNGDYYPSGVSITTSHSWDESGSYYLKVKAEDELGAQSDWSDPLYVTMPVYLFGCYTTQTTAYVQSSQQSSQQSIFTATTFISNTQISNIQN